MAGRRHGGKVRKGVLASAKLYCMRDEVNGKRATTLRFGKGMCRPVIVKQLGCITACTTIISMAMSCFRW